MNLTDFLIRVVILLVPGIATDLLYRHLRGRIVRKDWEDYLEMAVFSLITYICAGASLGLWRWVFGSGSTSPTFSPLRALYNKGLAINGSVVKEIILATIFSFPVALVTCYLEEYKVVSKLGRTLRATKRFGDEDVWDYLNRSPDVVWVFVRDHKQDLGYYGWIEAYSDPYKERELLLRDVLMYKNSTGVYLSKSSGIYIARKAEDLTIELVFPPPSQEAQQAEAKALNSTQSESNLVDEGVRK